MAERRFVFEIVDGGDRRRDMLAPEYAVRARPLAPDVWLVWLTGEVDLAAAPALRDELFEIVTATESNVIVDLTDVTLIDSATLGVLLMALRSLDRRGRSLSLVARDERILKTFRITALDRLFAMYGSVEEARGAAPEMNGRRRPNASAVKRRP
jgi:anti-sigma B factor antagonist